MPIRIKIYEHMIAQYKGMVNLNQLSKTIDIRRNALADYDLGQSVMLRIEHIEKLCAHFQIDDFNDLLEYIAEPLPERSENEWRATQLHTKKTDT